MSKKTNFSLIELFIVVAILAVLSSILVPSLNKALNSSKAVVCVNNLKSIVGAIHLYGEDHQRFPLYRKPHSNSTNPAGWFTQYWDDLLGAGYDGRNLTQAQMDSNNLFGDAALGAEIYSCPMDDGGARGGNGLESAPWHYEGQVKGKIRTYSMNSNQSGIYKKEHAKEAITGSVYGSQNPSKPWLSIPWSRSVDNVAMPSELLLLVESPGEGIVGRGGAAVTWNPEAQYRSWYYNEGPAQGVEDPPQQYHNGGWNYLFVDGHVENLLPEETKGTVTDQWNNPFGYWTNNPDD